MPLLRSTTHALLHAKSVLPLELLAYSFHTTCAQYASRERANSAKKEFRPSSRTRLVKDLKPKGKSRRAGFGRLEVAPRPKFQRDSAPHLEATSDPSQQRWSRNSRDDHKSNTDRQIPSTRYGAKAGGSGRSAGDHSKFSRTEKPLRSRSTRATALPSPLRLSANAPKVEPRKPKLDNPLVEEFDRSADPAATKNLPQEFISPPLMDGLLSSVHDVIGQHARPTPIQALSLKHLFSSTPESKWREFLLASETGSGKSLAYMLPMLQGLKKSEMEGVPREDNFHGRKGPSRTTNPRAIVLAPTHELSRQLSATAKSLVHNIKLRVLCASQANESLKASRRLTTAKLAALDEDGVDSLLSINTPRPVDVLVGTPSKILEMVRGHGWNWDLTRDPSGAEGRGKRKEFVVGDPEVGLENVEWVVVDEADVLLDPDFKDSTRMLLNDIAAARGHPVISDNTARIAEPQAQTTTDSYPFNFILTSATIPTALAAYLDTHHPNLVRLASPHLHRLPSTLKTEHASWTSGNRSADVEARIRRIWYGDTAHGSGVRSKVLVFCNKSTKVEELGRYFTEKGMPNVALTSTAESRKRGSNNHLNGFLRTPLNRRVPGQPDDSSTNASKTGQEPHVLITTSLLSRGLDFSPDIKNVLIIDSPRNMIDFLHRAGRTGRAGARGTVVVFGKSKGRGVAKDKEVRQKVKALA